MKKSFPWIVAVIAVIGFASSYSEFRRMRVRFGEVTHHQFHDHQDVRQYMIRAALAGLEHPVVILGDSIAEMAKLPDFIDGHPVVNAGIGGTTAADFSVLAPRLLADVEPSAIVVALGANSVRSSTFRSEYGALLSDLKKRAPKVYVVAVTPFIGSDAINIDIAAVAESEGVQVIETRVSKAEVFDGVHLDHAGSARWADAVVAGITSPRS